MKTYSFLDVVLTISHPSRGKLTTNGLGLGSVSVSEAGEWSEQSVASDGTVVVSKKKNRSGSFSLSIQQTSDLHNDLLKLNNYLRGAATSEWAAATAVLRTVSTGEAKTFKGVSIKNVPSAEYDAAVAMVTWEFLVADIQHDVI